MDLSQLIMFAAVGAAFYFLLIRPQQQQAKRQRQMVEELVAGAEIVTIGGIFATVVSPGAERIRVALADGAQLDIAPSAVSALVERAEEDDSADDESALQDSPEASDASSPGAEDADE
jgi:preprotein translocase subunit YajC